MAQKSKKRKKLSRRARREAGLTAAPKRADEGTPIPVTKTDTAKADDKPKQDAPIRRPDEPAGITASFTPDTPAAAPAETGAVRFADVSAKREPSGIDQELAASEYPAIRRDIRRLVGTIVCFAAVIAGLAVLNQQTDLITNFGRDLAGLWQ